MTQLSQEFFNKLQELIALSRRKPGRNERIYVVSFRPFAALLNEIYIELKKNIPEPELLACGDFQNLFKDFSFDVVYTYHIIYVSTRTCNTS